MKKTLIAACAVFALSLPATQPASAIDIKTLLGKAGDALNKTGDTLGNALEGVLTKSDLQLSDLCGSWQAAGSAVSFKSDNLLEKAGGVAAAAAIETKLDPYFAKYGLTGSQLTVNPDGTFTLKAGKVSLSGTITRNDDGSFEFNFSALGKIPVGSITAYVVKPPKKLKVMFDATKLKNLVSVIARYSGQSLAKTAASILDSYEGLCVGFQYAAI